MIGHNCIENLVRCIEQFKIENNNLREQLVLKEESLVVTKPKITKQEILDVLKELECFDFLM